MYSSDYCGCRIQLDDSMFGIDIERIQEKNKYVLLNDIESENLLLIAPPFLRDVEYVDTFSKRMITDSSGAYVIGVLGGEKTQQWSFQRECRFYIYQTLDRDSIHKVLNGNITNFDFNNRLYYQYYDLELNINVLNKIKIVLGPKCNEGHRIIVQSLLEKYTSNGSFETSKLTGKIK